MDHPSTPLRHSDPLVGSSSYVDRLGTRWHVEIEYLDVGGRLEACGFTMRSFDIVGRGAVRAGRARSLNESWQRVTTATVRALAMTQIEAECRRSVDLSQADDQYDAEGLDDDIEQLYDRAEYLASLLDADSGRRRYPPEHWEQVAATYRAAWRANESTAKAIAARWHVKPATARSWARKCRALDLLPATDERRAQG